MTTVPPAEIADATTFASSLTVQGAFTSKGIDDNADAVALTIDSSEHVLVGTTDSAVWNDTTGTGGINLRSDGILAAARNGGEPLLLNRLGTDGELIKFNKNGTTVGSIGTQGSRLSIGSGDVNLNFNASANSMYPISDPAAGTLSSGIVDLGAALATFKDAYLSGGIYLGGTAAANKLDDYESGSFTANGNWVANNNKYIKVGDLVTISMDLTGPASGSHSQFNLPFTCNATTAVGIYTTFASFSGGRTYATAVVAGGVCYLRQNGSGVQFAALNVGAGQVIHFSLSYYTTQ
jgi:hypothetical protein